MVDITDIGKLMLATPTPEQRGVGGFQNFVKTLNAVAEQLAEQKLENEKREAAKLKTLMDLEEQDKKLGRAEKIYRAGQTISPVDKLRIESEGITPTQMPTGRELRTPATFTPSDDPTLNTFIENMPPVQRQEYLERTGMATPSISEAETEQATIIPELKPLGTGKGLYQRNVYQPVINPDTKEVSYKLVGTEMSTTPADRYLQMPPQSQELPVGAELGKIQGSTEMINANIDEAKDIIQSNNLSMGWLRAQMLNPTGYAKSDAQQKVIDRMGQVKNRLLNLLSGAAVSTQEYERIKNQLDPKVGESSDRYFDRLELTRREINDILAATRQTKKEFVSGGKPQQKQGGTQSGVQGLSQKGFQEYLNKGK